MNEEDTPTPSIAERFARALDTAYRQGSALSSEAVTGFVEQLSTLPPENLQGQLHSLLIKQQETWKEAYVDDLTGLPNRRYFDWNLKDMVQRFVTSSAVEGHWALDEALQRFSQLQGMQAGFDQASFPSVEKPSAPAFALVFIDLNSFKPINDTYGHPVGDVALKAFADRLRKVTRYSEADRKSEFAARIGGDEFAILMTDDQNQRGFALGAQDRLQKALSGITIEAKNPKSGQTDTIDVGCSVGIYVLSDPALDPQDIIKRADALMYMDKAQRKLARSQIPGVGPEPSVQ